MDLFLGKTSTMFKMKKGKNSRKRYLRWLGLWLLNALSVRFVAFFLTALISSLI